MANPLTYAAYTAILKEFYGAAIQESLNNEILLKKWLETSSKQFDGLRVNYPVHANRNAGVGARAEGAALPTAGAQSHASVYVTAAYVYGRIDMTGQVMAGSKKTAFADALANEMEGVKTDLAFDVGRQAYGEGLGILAETGKTSCASEVYLKNRYFEPGQPGARYIRTGMSIDIGSATAPNELLTGAAVCSVTISMNSGTTVDTIGISSSLDAVTQCQVYLFNVNAGGAGVELKGLRAIVDDQTATNCYGLTGGMFNNDSIFNVDRGAVNGWNAYVSQNSGTERVIDSYLLQKTMSQIKKRSGKDVDVMFGEYDTVDAFWDSVAGDRRFTSKNFDAGVDTLTFNGKTMIKDLLAPYNELFLLSKPCIKWYVMKDFGFDDQDGSILKNVSGYDRHEAFIKAYLQIAPGETLAPNSCGVIRDIKVDL
jgi:hypothetical protein